jgi:hypothetical protein
MVHSIGLEPGARKPSLADLVRWSEIVNGGALVTPEMRVTLPKLEKLSRSGFPPQLAAQAAKLQEFVDEASAMLEPAVESILEMTGAAELRPAIESGVVTVADLGVGMDDALRAAVHGGMAGSDDEVVRFAAQVKQRLQDRRTRLLFDEDADSLVQAMLESGVQESERTGLSLARTAAVGAGFVARLPAFEEAPMDELLDLRGEMTDPLTRYRGAVAAFAQQVPEVMGSDLEAEVDQLWEQEALPALLEIKERLRDHTMVRELAAHARQDVGTYLLMGGGVFIGLTAAGALGQVATSVLSAGPAAATLVARANLSAEHARHEVERYDLFYLHATGERLGGS